MRRLLSRAQHSKEQHMAKSRSFFSRGRKIQTTDRFVSELVQRGLIMRQAGSADGAEWLVDGRPLRNFGSCSYMGLERHPALIAGAEAALHRYGSNFSISRAYLECELYPAFEETLGRAMDRAVMVAPSTTMAHLAGLPVLIGDQDLVLIDQFAHASLHMATDLIDDVPIEILRHSRVDLLEQKLVEAGDRFEKVWYVCDGIYSMLGDLAPFEALKGLLERHPRLHLYVDDAHGMSWTGRHGRGPALTHLGASDRVIVAVSLSKAFGAVGGALAFPDVEQRDRVRRCGGPMIFSGPIAPAGLGAGLASAELHLLPEFETMQAELRERMDVARDAIHEAGLTLATDDLTPIFMIHYDAPATAQNVVARLRERGFFACVSTFPAVPVNKPSIRFTVSRHNSLDDVRDMIRNLVEVSADIGARAFRPSTPAPFDHAELRRVATG
jgi:7-keto-8-aminopelargonate synthetase-like enzyme